MSQDENAIKPCPECQSTEGYVPVGDYRAQCLNCNAVLKKEEVLNEDPQ